MLAEQPSSAELAAAADVAARLGFETSAMDLPVVRPTARPTTVPRAGADDLHRREVAGAGRRQPRDDRRRRAEGGRGPRRRRSRWPVVPPSRWSATTAASSPRRSCSQDTCRYVWDQKGPTTDKIADDVKEFLVGKGRHGSLRTRVVRPGARSDRRRRAPRRRSCRWPAAAISSRRRSRCNQFKATGARDAKRALVVRERARRCGSGCARLGRAAATDRPAASDAGATDAAVAAARRGGPAAARRRTSISRSFYANDGALADSDNNLIPDRVDVLLSADGDGAEGVVDLAARLGLESTGISLPIAKTAKSITAPDERADPRPDRHVASGRRAADQEQQVGARRRCSRAKG